MLREAARRRCPVGPSTVLTSRPIVNLSGTFESCSCSLHSGGRHGLHHTLPRLHGNGTSLGRGSSSLSRQNSTNLAAGRYSQPPMHLAGRRPVVKERSWNPDGSWRSGLGSSARGGQSPDPVRSGQQCKSLQCTADSSARTFALTSYRLPLRELRTQRCVSAGAAEAPQRGSQDLHPSSTSSATVPPPSDRQPPRLSFLSGTPAQHRRSPQQCPVQPETLVMADAISSGRSGPSPNAAGEEAARSALPSGFVSATVTSPTSDAGVTLCERRQSASECSDTAPNRNNNDNSGDKKKKKPKDPALLKVSRADALELAAALDRLKTELPDVLREDRHFTICSDDVVLENGLSMIPYRTRGLAAYRGQARVFRVKWSLLYRDLEFHLLSCEKVSEDSCVVARWKVVGTPKWLPGKLASPERVRYLDGISTFDVNGLGEVHRHKVTKLRRNDDRWLVRAVPAIGLLALGFAGVKKELSEGFSRVFRRW